MMRILIDLQGAQNGSRYRGIGRYSLALAKAIARNRGSHEVFILLNGLFPETIDDIRGSFAGLLPSYHFIIFNAPGPVDELPTENYWRVRSAELLRERLINDLKPDILLVSSLFEGACDNTIISVGQLFSQVQTAVILYDLIPYLDPEKYIGWAPLKNWYNRKIDALKEADLLLAISGSAQREAIEHLGVKPERTVNISSAVDASFRKTHLSPHKLSSLLARYGIKRKFLMHSSAFDERKNFEGLIKAFGFLSKKLRKDFQLVLVCKIDETGRKALNNLASTVGLEKDDLVLTGFVSDDDLIALYSECYLFVFPSFHEGFGLPALEAMCCGAPAIGSNTSSIPEVIGREDALFDPKSTESIAHLIERVLVDSAFRQSLKEHSITQSQKFSWDKTAIVAIEAFEKAHADKIYYCSLNKSQNDFVELIENITIIKSEVQPSEQDLIKVAVAIEKNENNTSRLKSFADFGGRLKWRIEGPFDSTYSLALLNRETARALEELGHFVVLHSTEGPGDFPADPEFVASNPDIAMMHARVADYPHSAVDVASRNLYPPRVEDMRSPLNLLHHYAWEESGFPQDWVNNFNAHLNGITCLSNHVEKILIDNGVSVPMITSGCGVDHWERVNPAPGYQIKAKRFRFLHVSSCFPRKGVDLLLDAYGKTFTSAHDVTLIIKTFKNPHNEIHRLLAERKAQNFQFPDVLIIEGDMSDSELKALYQQCHVLVAPSKAEGFGLPMAEAMLSGLPVITTAWGGQLDFCNEGAWLVDYEFERAKTHFGVFTSVWAKIDVDGLANALLQACNSTQEHLTAKALAGRKQLLESFRWVDIVGRAVNAAHTWRTACDKQPDVKIGWITSWNTRCGIAAYSEHLISNIAQENVTVLAPRLDSRTQTFGDDTSCIRCWDQGKENNDFSDLAKYVSQISLNTIVIQFNYGFYNFPELSEFIEQQLNNGLVIIVMMHSTYDPYGETANWRLIELQSILSRCHRILVHSIPDLNRLKGMGLVENVALFPHGIVNCPITGPVEKGNNLPLVASYGFCLPHKGLTELVEAIGMLKAQGQLVRLKMVNAEYPDPSSSELINKLKERIRELKIDDLVEMHTDFLADKESLSLLSNADLLVFAYQQTGESSSAAVRYGISTKRPIAVTPLDIFEDVGSAVFRFAGTSPKDIADGITVFLSELSANTVRAKHIQREAQTWRDQHDYAVVSKRLFNICTALVRKHPLRTYCFHGGSPLLKTEVGSIQGKNMVTTGIAGNLIHGPYLALAAGQYRVVIRGTLGENGLAGARMDVTVGLGNLTLAESALNEPDDEGCFVTLPISLEAPCTDLEVRIFVSENTDLLVSTIEITR